MNAHGQHHAPLTHSTRSHRTTIADLRAAIADLPDEALVMVQAVTEDHTAFELVSPGAITYGRGVLEVLLPSDAKRRVIGPYETEALLVNGATQ